MEPADIFFVKRELPDLANSKDYPTFAVGKVGNGDLVHEMLTTISPKGVNVSLAGTEAMNLSMVTT